MTRELARRWAGTALWTLVLLCPAATVSRAESESELAPGPSAMTAEERARSADPAAGILDAVILTEATKRVETSPGRSKIWYHLRAKVFSEAGLRLATVAIPSVDEGTKIEQWWGHVILPTGAVVELRRDKLHDGVDPVTGKRSIAGVLPRAAAGCVIDWGYVLTKARFPAFDVVTLEREWFIDRLSYRWRRLAHSAVTEEIGGYRVVNAASGVRVTRDYQGALLSAEHIAPAASAQTGGAGRRLAALALWELRSDLRRDDSLVVWPKVQERFWREAALTIEAHVAHFAGNAERLRAVLQSIPLPDGKDLPDRLRAAYAWIDANVKVRPGARTGNPAGGSRTTKGRAQKVLMAGVGTDIERTLCFLAVARALGAEASLVLATDRRVWAWDRGLLIVEQFSHALVEVRAPDAGVAFVAPGSGLPYGHVPQETMGGKALRVTSHGAETVEVPIAGGD